LVEAGLGQDEAGPGECPYLDHGVVLIDDCDRLGFSRYASALDLASDARSFGSSSDSTGRRPASMTASR
jgi:hypothetical protein